MASLALPTLPRPLVWLLFVACAGCGAALAGPSTSGPVTVDVPVQTAPPPDKKDPPRPPSPGFGYLWVAGHWDNVDGNYIWKEGRWIPAKADYEYVRAHYDFDAARGSWIYHRPHWKRRHAAVPDGGTGS
jgi:hypothetical protein